MTAWWTTAWDWALICLTGVTAGAITAGIIGGVLLVFTLFTSVITDVFARGALWMLDTAERWIHRYRTWRRGRKTHDGA